MAAQTRALLDGYAAAGGRYRETVIQDSGHGPHLDQAEQFRAALAEHLAAGYSAWFPRFARHPSDIADLRRQRAKAVGFGTPF
jgi:hypothetical protein